jgi:hypothetical protein
VILDLFFGELDVPISRFHRISTPRRSHISIPSIEAYRLPRAVPGDALCDGDCRHLYIVMMRAMCENPLIDCRPAYEYDGFRFYFVIHHLRPT